MLQVQFLRENRDEVIKSLKIKNFKKTSIIDKVINLDDKRKLTQSESDELLSKANKLAKQIGVLYKSGKSNEAKFLKEESIQIKDKTKALNSLLSQIESKIYLLSKFQIFLINLFQQELLKRIMK